MTTRSKAPAEASARSQVGSPVLILMLLVIDSGHFVFARLLLPQISPSVSAMYVLAIATAQVGLFGLVTGRLHLRALLGHPLFFATIGLLVAASTAINYAAVAFIDPGTAAMLGKTSIVFGVGFGLLWLGDRLSPKQVAGSLLALIGVFIITFQPVDYLRFGSLLVVSSAFLYALHAAVVKRYSGDMDLLNFFFYRLLLTTGFLLLFAVARQALVWPSPKAWLYLLLTGTVDVVISRSLYYVALRRLAMSVFSIILTLSPVAAILWSVLLFGTFPSLQQLVGGVAVLLGVLAVTLNRS